ncbi:MAG: hypothetical protein AMJ75_00380 [Phycisphaerae bacterium SM1_79]|nr:MAG: hypothetical protein AMJ75_00380 [Phycisphaerae bacterium SM1_79]
MANICMRNVILYDKWPGVPDPNLGIPTDGFDASGTHSCVTTAVYPPGTKIMAYNDGTYNPGWYTMCYMQFCEGSDLAYDADSDLSTGYGLCFHYEGTNHPTDALGSPQQAWWGVTSDLTNSDGSQGGALAVAVRDLSGTDDAGGNEFGWFWVGGVCPCNTTTQDMTKCGNSGPLTDGNVAAGQPFYAQDDGSNAAELALYQIDSTKSTEYASALGWSLAADA